MFLHAGTNIVNEVYDVRKGIDTITSPRASHAIVKGRMSERTALLIAGIAFALAIAVGVYLVWLRGPGDHRPRAARAHRRLGLHGAAARVQEPRARRAARVPADGPADGRGLVLRGERRVVADRARRCRSRSASSWRRSCTATSGATSARTAGPGISTLSARIGRRWAHYGYVALVLGAYMVLALSVIAGSCRPGRCSRSCRCRSSPQVIRSAELGATGQARAIAMIDLQTARLHLAFGSLLVLGLVALQASVRWLSGAASAAPGAQVAPGALAVGLVAAQAAFAATFRGPRDAVLAADDDDRARPRVAGPARPAGPRAGRGSGRRRSRSGLASAATLYATFKVGDALRPALRARAATPRSATSTRSGRCARRRRSRPGSATIIGPAEELFWRGLVQEALMARLRALARGGAGGRWPTAASTS